MANLALDLRKLVDQAGESAKKDFWLSEDADPGIAQDVFHGR